MSAGQGFSIKEMLGNVGHWAGKGLGSLLGIGGYNAPGMKGGRANMQGAWVAAGQSAPGSPTRQQNGLFWGGANSLVVPINGGVVNSILIESPRLNLSAGSAPTIQKLRVAAIDGQLDPVGYFNSTTAPTANQTYTFNVGIGIYIAEYNVANSLYLDQDPLAPIEVSRFDWEYLECRSVQCTGLNALTNAWAPVRLTSYMPKMLDLLNVAMDIQLNSGEALMLSVNVTYNSSNNAATLPGTGTNNFVLTPAIRMFLAYPSTP